MPHRQNQEKTRKLHLYGKNSPKNAESDLSGGENRDFRDFRWILRSFDKPWNLFFLHVTKDNVSTGYLKVNFDKKI